mmetsp:Transcript_4060/g.16267  ORF Transcript_4060/g.16267 Transcript_4060/m.16267 type:complete len:216 (-) Transcript_4060:86-733(-)
MRWQSSMASSSTGAGSASATRSSAATTSRSRPGSPIKAPRARSTRARPRVGTTAPLPSAEARQAATDAARRRAVTSVVATEEGTSGTSTTARLAGSTARRPGGTSTIARLAMMVHLPWETAAAGTAAPRAVTMSAGMGTAVMKGVTTTGDAILTDAEAVDTASASATIARATKDAHTAHACESATASLARGLEALRHLVGRLAPARAVQCGAQRV